MLRRFISVSIVWLLKDDKKHINCFIVIIISLIRAFNESNKLVTDNFYTVVTVSIYKSCLRSMLYLYIYYGCKLTYE